MQSIAAENNLAETAFFVKTGPIGRFALRWFTPACEVDLCGHATLATAHVIFSYLQPERTQAVFETKSGDLTVKKNGQMLTLDFPSRPPSECAYDESLLRALGGSPKQVLAARDYLVVYETEEEIRALTPDMQALCAIDRFAVIVTAPGREVDFVSRFFAPAKGVAEDPVTGSAHCTLIPYWAARLGRNELRAHQASLRGGDLWCELDGDRVRMSGHAVRTIEGHFFLD